MVYQLQFQYWRWAQALVVVVGLGSVVSLPALAETAEELMQSAQAFHRNGHYFKAARYAYSAAQTNDAVKAESYSWITVSLVEAGLYNASAYFFIRTLQSGNREAIRRVLKITEDFLVVAGGDLFLKYLVRHTQASDYDAQNSAAYHYALGKQALLANNEDKALALLAQVRRSSPLWPFAMQMRGTANAILGRVDAARSDFHQCSSHASQVLAGASQAKDPTITEIWTTQRRRQVEDLEARCLAGEARVLYQDKRFQEAERVYETIPKRSMVWTDVLMEQAWDAFARKEYNRTLGRLVSYRSPDLRFVFNPEVDVLRAQAFMAMCLYGDTNETINEFNSKYAKTGERVKRFIESNASNLGAFYGAGKTALQAKLHTEDEFSRILNRFVRSPYFQNLVGAERVIRSEAVAVGRFDSLQPGVSHAKGEGFPGFLRLVLGWRLKSVRLLGGAFVKNSLLDHYSNLIDQFERVAFIKVEMLARARERLQSGPSQGDSRRRGSVQPTRRDDEYYWSFNGEFWNDELGDYVFGLESKCQG